MKHNLLSNLARFLLIAIFLSTSLLIQPGRTLAETERSIVVRVTGMNRETFSALALEPQVQLNYGSFWWLALTPVDFERLVASDIPYDVVADANQVHVPSYRFDPLFDGEPRLPAGLRAGENAAQPGFRLIQLSGPVKSAWVEQLQAMGLPILQYYPHNTYLTWAVKSRAMEAEALGYVRWQGDFHPAYKIDASLAQRSGLIKQVDVLFYNDGNMDGSVEALEALGAKVVQVYPAQPDQIFWDAIVELDAAALADAARLETVLWMGYSSPEARFDDENADQIVAGNVGSGTPPTGYHTWLANLGLDGSGITWADVDTGLDDTHPDITGRATAYVSYAGAANTDPDGHGSHTAGAIFGDGRGGSGLTDPNGFYWGTGMAPAANLVVQNALMGSSWPPSGGWQVLSRDSVVNGAIGSSNSWYTGASGAQGYSSAARTHDLMVRDANFDTPTAAEPLVMVFSAGNSGPGSSTLTEPKEAKNLISVGASSNYPRSGSTIDDIVSFSSRGPALDGRTLPNVMAPGWQTVSFNSTQGSSSCNTSVAGTALYSYCSGTSMAAPLVSGASILIADWWGQQGWGTPSPAMTKAMLINGAADMFGGDDGNSGTITHVPNNYQGWGRVNLTSTFDASVPTLYYDQTSLFQDTGETWALTVGVADPSKPVKITLVWSDAAGAAGASPALVNNLDLLVENNGSAYRGNVFSNGWSIAGGSADVLNNIENVYIQNASGAATITIQAVNLAGDGLPYNGDNTDQDFALVCANCVHTAGFTLGAVPDSRSVCAAEDAHYTLNVGQLAGYDQPVMLSANSIPAGASASFSLNPVTPASPPATSTLTIGNTGALAYGSYELDVVGVSFTHTHTATIGLNVYTLAPVPVNLNAPANGAINVVARPTFTWNAVAQAETYRIEIATDSGFHNVVDSATLVGTSYTPASDLSTSMVFYWRVTADNICGAGISSATWVFTTESVPGDCAPGTIPQVLFQDDFESGAAGWASSGAGNTWTLAAARPYAGSYSYRATGSSTVSDQRLVSPAVALPAGAGHSLTLQYWNWQAIEDRAGGCYDGAILEISADSGTTWTQLLNAVLQTDPYDGPVSTSYSNPLGGLDAWCGDPADWTESVVDLDAYAGQTVQFRYRLGTDSSTSREGWYVDDVVVQSCVPASVNFTFGPDSDMQVMPGAGVTHTFNLHNLGVTDAYTLTLESGLWNTSLLTSSPLAVNAGSSALVQVRVDAPLAAGEDVFTVTARSVASPTLAMVAVGTSEVPVLPGVTIDPGRSTVGGAPDQKVFHTFTLTNSGNIVDNFILGLSGNGWVTTVPTETGYLAPGVAVPILVEVHIPAQPVSEAVLGRDTFTLTATSSLDAAARAVAVGETLATVQPGVILSPVHQEQVGALGGVVTYTFALTNSGLYTDTFLLSLVGNDWETSLPVSTTVVAPSASAEIVVVVVVPADPLAARDVFTLTAVSSLDANLTAAATGETQALVQAGVAVAPASLAQVGAAGEVVTYTFVVTNTGSFVDDFTLAVTSTWTAQLSTAQIAGLQPGESVAVTLAVTIPETAQGGAFDTATLAVTSGLDTAVQAGAVARTSVKVSGYRVYLPLLIR
ncbi:MAG: S8 family serine peptidase [Chloroflexota bacterium]